MIICFFICFFSLLCLVCFVMLICSCCFLFTLFVSCWFLLWIAVFTPFLPLSMHVFSLSERPYREGPDNGIVISSSNVFTLAFTQFLINSMTCVSFWSICMSYPEENRRNEQSFMVNMRYMVRSLSWKCVLLTVVYVTRLTYNFKNTSIQSIRLFIVPCNQSFEKICIL